MQINNSRHLMILTYKQKIDINDEEFIKLEFVSD